MINKEMLEAIGQMMDAKLENALGQMQKENNARFDRLEQGQAKLEQGQTDLQQQVSSLRQSVVRLETTVDHHMMIIREGLDGFKERGPQIDRIEAKQEEHGHRIWALEEKVRHA